MAKVFIHDCVVGKGREFYDAANEVHSSYFPKPKEGQGYLDEVVCCLNDPTLLSEGFRQIILQQVSIYAPSLSAATADQRRLCVLTAGEQSSSCGHSLGSSECGPSRSLCFHKKRFMPNGVPSIWTQVL